MRSICLACCLVAALPSWGAAQEVAATPFWLLPKVELNASALARADIKLVAPPDRSREFALLQVGDNDPRNVAASVSNLEAAYRMVAGGLEVGSPPYSDRSFQITQLPKEFAGLALLQTKMDDKAVLDGRYAIVLEAAKPCMVFVAVEEPALETYKQHGVPYWLQEYGPTGHQLVTDHPSRGNYRVFVRQARAGRIVLGPPCLEVRANSMYFAFFAEAK